MLKKFLPVLLIIFMAAGGTVQAYDLPKFKPAKKVSQPVEKPDKKSGKQEMPTLKSDWKNAELFEQQLRERLAKGEELAPDDPARLPLDKNYVFIAFYNDAPFFLDKYSLKILRNEDGTKVWQQKIFPISPKYSPRNAKAKSQNFCLIDGKIYNATKANDGAALTNLAEDNADRIFLQECFKIGYFYAFGEAAPN